MKTVSLATVALALGGATAHRGEFQPERANGFTPIFASSGPALKASFSTETAALKSLGTDFEVVKQYTSKHNGVKHTYVQQLVNGIAVKNGVAQVNSKNGKVISFSSSFFKGEVPVLKLGELKIDAAEATRKQMAFLGAEGCANEVDPSLRYVVTEDGSLTLAYRIECDLSENWMESYVSAETGETVSQIDYFHQADGDMAAKETSGTYSVFTVPNVDPGLAANIPQLVTLPHLDAYPAEASTLGWHDQGFTNGTSGERRTFTTTIGNNVYAQENLNGGSQFLDNYRPDGGSELNFNTKYDHSKEPEENLDSSIANLFFLNNLQHDIFYGYGFDEESGNFQENNMGRGGKDGDAVQANAQDGSGVNNANFASPPDGRRPRMNMFVWDEWSPKRDGDLEAGIVFHEYGHGITNRLTGGADNAGCLSGVAGGGGMGEGWGDFFGKIISLKETDKPEDAYPMGDWIVGPGGIRNFPYSKNMETNPLTFGNMNASPYRFRVHAAGTVWCTVLWDAMWDMIDVYGWDADIRACGTGGNNKMLQLVVDGLKLQPCKPTMLDARDAILLADEVTYDGKNACTLWRAFARRGFGVDATAGTGFLATYEESFKFPSSCNQ